MKNKKLKKTVITREDIEDAIAEFLSTGGSIKKISAGKLDPEVLKKGFSEIEDDSFWFEREAPLTSSFNKVQHQGLNEV